MQTVYARTYSYILKIKEYIAVSWLHGYAERNADTQVNAVVVSIMRRLCPPYISQQCQKFMQESGRGNLILVCMSANICSVHSYKWELLCFFSAHKVMH